MAKHRILFGFHSVGVRLRTAASSIDELYVDPSRRDARMRQLVDRAKAAGVRLMDADGLRLSQLCAERRSRNGLSPRIPIGAGQSIFAPNLPAWGVPSR